MEAAKSRARLTRNVYCMQCCYNSRDILSNPMKCILSYDTSNPPVPLAFLGLMVDDCAPFADVSRLKRMWRSGIQIGFSLQPVHRFENAMAAPH